MDKKSGVYYELTDSSLRLGGSSTFGGIALMYTTKGEVGKLNRVSIRDYRDVIGFDLEYNPNYLGLERMLSSVTYMDVFRLNRSPTVSYGCWDEDGEPVSLNSLGYEDYRGIEEDVPAGGVWVSYTSPGSWANDTFVAFSKTSNADEYVLHHYYVVNGFSRSIGNYTFSTVEDEENYYKNVKFGDLVFDFKGSFPTATTFFVDPSIGLPQTDDYKLVHGTNGGKLNDYTEVKDLFYAIDSSPANVVVLNGFFSTPITDVEIIKAIIEYCGAQDRSVLIDAPVLTNDNGVLSASGAVGQELYTWANSLCSLDVGQYAQVVAVPDQVTVSGTTYLIQPSAYLFQIYARMFADTETVNYPPAGYVYGRVNANKLMENDFHLHGDTLKTNRINYLVSSSKGVCMWEYRTLYTYGNSDLSYASTPFILRDLKGRLMSFMSEFTFRYSTPVDLLTIHSGLSAILDSFRDNFFLVNYTLYVPSYEEAQAAGRQLNIDIEVSVINSADVITLRVNLRNAADLRAA